MSEDTQSFLDLLVDETYQNAANEADVSGRGGLPDPGTYNCLIIGTGEGVVEKEWGKAPWKGIDLRVLDAGPFENHEFRYFMNLAPSKEGKPRRGTKDLIALGTTLALCETRHLPTLNTILDAAASQGDVVVRAKVYSYMDRSYMEFLSCETECPAAVAIVEEASQAEVPF